MLMKMKAKGGIKEETYTFIRCTGLIGFVASNALGQRHATVVIHLTHQRKWLLKITIPIGIGK